MKTCRVCGETKPFADFFHLMPSGRPRGRVCKKCETAKIVARRRELHPTKPRVRVRQAEHITDAKRKAWRDKNRSRLNEQARAHYMKNRDARLARQRELRALDPFAKEKDRAKAHAYNARKRGVFVEMVDPQAVWVRDGGVCGICWNEIDRAEFEIDHITPLAAGGQHSMANVQAAHRFCNRSKGARPAPTPALIRGAWDQAETAARATGKEPLVVLSYVDGGRRTYWEVRKLRTEEEAS